MVAFPLVSFENVSKRYRDGYRDIVALDRVSFEFGAEIFIGVWGTRRAGKSTLLRLMAGVESPDSGTIRFDGRDVGMMSLAERERLLRADIALVATDTWCARPSEAVVDYVALSLGSGAWSLADARRRARHALDRVGMTDQADEATRCLSLAERMRVMLAQALAREPRLLLVDEPALLPSLVERDAFYALLRDVARELRATLVTASEDMAPLHGAEIVMSIGDGELCSTDERGTIVGFPGASQITRSEL